MKVLLCSRQLNGLERPIINDGCVTKVHTLGDVLWACHRRSSNSSKAVTIHWATCYGRATDAQAIHHQRSNAETKLKKMRLSKAELK